MLMVLGPVQFEVWPFNATDYEHGHESAFAEKPVLGARPPLEWVGDGPETWTIKARIFPRRFGGLKDLKKLATVRAVNPDVTILHAQQVDARGNVLVRGILGATREAALAARSVLFTVEEQVEKLDAPMNATVFPVPQYARTADSPSPVLLLTVMMGTSSDTADSVVRTSSTYCGNSEIAWSLPSITCWRAPA